MKPTTKLSPKEPQKKGGKQIIPAKNPANSLFFKLMWYSVLALMLFVFLKQTNPVDPDIKIEPSEDISFSGFTSGKDQKSFENQLLNKPFFIELKKTKNEYEYQLFGKVNLDECYSGKDGYIFGESMTRASFGDDFIGTAAIKTEVEKAKFVQNKLNELGIPMLILFAPGKSTIYPEYLPDMVTKTKMKTKNSTTYIDECKALGVNHIDFIQYFLALRNITQLPLFSQYGSHWSYFGECIAVDTTITRLERLMNVNLPSFRFGDIQLMDTALVRDADIFRKIPMHKIPKGKALAYPQSMTYEQGNGVTPQKITAIGDSYLRGFFYLGAMDNAFAGSKQWYYYNSIIPEDPSNPEVWQLDLKAEILKTKAVLVLCNEMNLKNLGNGFIDDAYLMFSDEAKFNAYRRNKFEINTLKKEIRNDKELIDKLTIESHSRSITLDSVITETAKKRQIQMHNR